MGDQRIANNSGYDIGHVFATHGEGSNIIFHEHIENDNLWTEEACLALCSIQKGSRTISSQLRTKTPVMIVFDNS